MAIKRGNPVLHKFYLSGGEVIKHRIVKWGNDDDHVIQAADTTDAMMGVSDALGADAAEKGLDVIRSGLAPVEYGGNITRGEPLTSDADGKAVAAAPGAGVNMRIIGFAEESGTPGDIGLVSLEPGQIQGA